ncbi:MAG: PAS domain-containing protein [Candidatus Brocadiales bacterium]|nr:PAS domain-containing protein [Candidatus Bathyanammoxibius sp.]
MVKGARVLPLTLVLLLISSSLVYGDVDYTKDPTPTAPEMQDEGAADETLGKDEVSLIQNFIDSSSATIYLKDDEGRFIMVNRQFAELVKLSKEELIGKTDYDFATEEEADKFRANDRKVAETGTSIVFKETLTLDDGQHTYISHKFLVSNVEGSPNAVGGISIDITKCECR